MHHQQHEPGRQSVERDPEVALVPAAGHRTLLPAEQATCGAIDAASRTDTFARLPRPGAHLNFWERSSTRTFASRLSRSAASSRSACTMGATVASSEAPAKGGGWCGSRGVRAKPYCLATCCCWSSCHIPVTMRATWMTRKGRRTSKPSTCSAQRATQRERRNKGQLCAARLKYTERASTRFAHFLHEPQHLGPQLARGGAAQDGRQDYREGQER